MVAKWAGAMAALLDEDTDFSSAELSVVLMVALKAALSENTMVDCSEL